VKSKDLLSDLVEDHVPQGVEVQVLSSAHVTKNPRNWGFFCSPNDVNMLSGRCVATVLPEIDDGE